MYFPTVKPQILLNCHWVCLDSSDLIKTKHDNIDSCTVYMSYLHVHVGYSLAHQANVILSFINFTLYLPFSPVPVFPLLCSLLLFFCFSSSHCPALPLCYPGNGPIEKACCLGHTRSSLHERGDREIEGESWGIQREVAGGVIVTFYLYQQVAHTAIMLLKKHFDHNSLISWPILLSDAR